MIHRKKITDGVLLKANPFTGPNLNAGSSIIAKITSTNGSRRDVQIFVCDLNNVMTFTDAGIFITAMRALMGETKKQMETVQRSARPRKRIKPKKRLKRKKK